MRAVLRRRYGGPDRVELAIVARPQPSDSQVRIRVHASSVNPADRFAMLGRPFPYRFVGGLLRPTQPVLGIDAAGVVDAVGRGVTRFAPGDAVFGELSGSYAEYVCADEARLVPMPAGLGFDQAATLPVAALTALQAVRDLAELAPGKRFLVNGASGGVGSFAVQLARAAGAEVTGVCSTRNLEVVRSLGADHVIDYTAVDFSETGERYDAILDLAGSASVAACRRCLTPRGVYIASVGRMSRIFAALFSSLLPGPRVVVQVVRADAGDLAEFARLVERGVIAPVIERTVPLDAVSDALRRQGEGHARGKTVVVVRDAVRQR